MEKVIFIAAIAIYTLLYAIYFFGFKKSGKELTYSRYVVLSIIIVSSLAVGYFTAVLMQTGTESYTWGVLIFIVGLFYGVWRFIRL